MNLKKKLDHYYTKYNSILSENDPIEFPYHFKEPLNIELSAFIASVFSYGNISAIKKTLNDIFDIMGNDPADFLTNSQPVILTKSFAKTKYRFYTANDISIFMSLLKQALAEYGSLKDLFYTGYNPAHTNVKFSIEHFHQFFLKNISAPAPGINFMFPLPSNNSCCKRINLFLRWMVRKDNIDFGLWDKISPSRLVIPVDTHIAKISKALNLTYLKNPSWKMAEEITSNLAKYDPEDPVKYDFALCHLGVNKLKF